MLQRIFTPSEFQGSPSQANAKTDKSVSLTSSCVYKENQNQIGFDRLGIDDNFQYS